MKKWNAPKFTRLLKLLYRFPSTPIARIPVATPDTYRDLFLRFKRTAPNEVDALENHCGFAIDREWLDLLALSTQVVVKESDLNWHHGRVLYAVSRKLLAHQVLDGEPVVLFETGTARGFSSVVLARSLIDADRNGFVVTVDSLPPNDKIFWNSIRDTTGPSTRFELLSDYQAEVARILFLQGWTPRVLGQLGLKRIHLAFLDGSHSQRDVLKEFDFVSQRQEPGDIVIFDDVTKTSFPGVANAVEKVKYSGVYAVEFLKSSTQRGYAIATKG